MNGHVVSVPDDVVADIEVLLRFTAEHYGEHKGHTGGAYGRLQTFLKDYKEQSKEE